MKTTLFSPGISIGVMSSLYACVTEQHDLLLVGLAAFICALGITSSVALGREAARLTERRMQLAWATAGVVALASAIWATHFIAMLAYRPGLPVRFDIGLTAFSYVAALVLVGSGAAIVGLASRRGGRIAGGIVIGLAIPSMHYIGMSAYEIQGHLRWDPEALGASILAGLVFGGLAVAAETAASSSVRRLTSPLLILAVVLTHFIGMSAVTLEFDPRTAEPSGTVNQTLLIGLVTNVALIIVGLSFVALGLALRARRQLADEEVQVRDLADIAVEGLMICRDGHVVGANASLKRILGAAAAAALIGRPAGDVVPGLDLSSTAFAVEIDAEITNAAGAGVPVRVICRDIVIGRRRHVVVAVRDQRERLSTEAAMMRLAHQDALTGLANRLSFTTELAARCATRRKGDGAFALLTLDIDRFKIINDTLGLGTGDELLRRAASRLKRAVRDADVVARLGGDEFSILAPDADDLAAVRAIAERVIDLLGRPYLIDGKVVMVSASVGVALAPSDGETPEALARAADLALYQAKSEGGDAYRLFETDMNARAQAKRALELDLRRAAARAEFEVFYQPQVDPRTGAFEGAEALIRWRHPERGMVSPMDFIPLAEEIGLISGIGEWVLRTACAEAASWPGELKVAVNLSPVQLRDPRFAEIVAGVLADTGLAGGRLELEITENALLQDDGGTLAILHALRALGVRISMDDFGTGYSSLSYLRRFPFDKIKIDQSFIRQLPADEDSAAIVQAITGLAGKLGMTVTAEGVETAEQRAFTISEGCDQIQGYLISKPAPAAEIAVLFSAPALRHAVA